MGDHSTTPSTKNITLPKLGELQFVESDHRPLGGLNYYSPAYLTAGEALVQLLIQHAGLDSGSRILDIGCGTGRIVKALSKIIDPAMYVGIDINKRYIETAKALNNAFNFIHYDLCHDEYNPLGVIDPAVADYPADDRSFDIVCAFGVLNHNRSKWVMQSLRSIAKKLKPKGIFIATMLLLNQTSMSFLNSGKTKRPFILTNKSVDEWSQAADRPLLNIAIPEVAVRRTCIKSRLMIKEPIRYGHWIAHEHALTTHDVLIAQKQST